MRVVSVNVGMPREVVWQGMTVQTGIFKEPVAGPVTINKLNLAGDKQADLTVHGGPAKAVYAYPAEHYEYWRRELPDVSFPWGKFGENLTTEGLLEDALCIGDRVSAGSAILMATQPRMPCYKLALRFERDDMIKRFLKSGRSGCYFSVIEPGEVRAGSKIEILSRDPNRIVVADITRLYLGQTGDSDLLERAMNVSALPENWKAALLADTIGGTTHSVTVSPKRIAARASQVGQARARLQNPSPNMSRERSRTRTSCLCPSWPLSS